MSESDLSDAPSAAVPPDSELEKDLRHKVRKAAKAHEAYTVNSIRTASEKSLDLPEGFYKGHETWNGRSKTIIKAEADKASSTEDQSPEPESAPVKTKAPAKRKPADKPQPKRTAPEETSRPRKKTKPTPHEKEVNSDSSGELSSPPSDFSDSSEKVAATKSRKKTTTKNSKKPLAKSKAKPKPSAPVSSELSDAESVTSAPEDVPAQKEGNSSESEMSVVLDDAPIKKRSKSKDTSEQKSKPPKSKSTPTEEADPDKEDIKKLQGWLVKCGIRKVWGKELKPYETSKAKIKHLKGMLSEAGMTGRFSNEKAASIKEARELAADIEAVKEGAQRWGKSDEDEGDGSDAEDKTRSGRRIVRGAKNYAFLSSDGEETD